MQIADRLLTECLEIEQGKRYCNDNLTVVLVDL